MKDTEVKTEFILATQKLLRVYSKSTALSKKRKAFQDYCLLQIEQEGIQSLQYVS